MHYINLLTYLLTYRPRPIGNNAEPARLPATGTKTRHVKIKVKLSK